MPDPDAEIELPPNLAAQLNALAAAMDRSLAWMIERALSDYVALEAYRLADTPDDTATPTAPGEDIIAWVRSLKMRAPGTGQMRRAA